MRLLFIHLLFVPRFALEGQSRSLRNQMANCSQRVGFYTIFKIISIKAIEKFCLKDSWKNPGFLLKELLKSTITGTVMSTVTTNLSFTGHCWVKNQTAKNFTASGQSIVAGLVCENLFHSSGHSRILSSKLNKVSTSGSTNLMFCTANEIRSSGYLQALQCPRLGKVTVSGQTAISGCAEIEKIVASGAFSLDASKVTGNVVLSGNSPEIANSTIAGTLECASKIIKISNSSIGRIVVKPIHTTSRFELFNWNISQSSSPTEQLIELSGKNCQVGSISFTDGAVGKVLLRNGATAPKNLSE